MEDELSFFNFIIIVLIRKFLFFIFIILEFLELKVLIFRVVLFLLGDIISVLLNLKYDRCWVIYGILC